MKALLLAAALSVCTSAFSQYYYKDIIGTKETAELVNVYKTNKVNRVMLNSYDGEGVKSDDFYVEQIFSPATQTLKTITRSGVTDESMLTAFINANGQVSKTVDSSATLLNIATYNYDAEGRLISLVSTTTDSSRRIAQTEEHKWEYDNGRIIRMVRIKNGTDTTLVTFKLDEAGNVIEEKATRTNLLSEPVYYYYDGQNRLTDIVRYNTKARRLLPEYMFEYSPANQVIQKITVPANGSQYLIWRYQYDNRGLKIKEAVFDKQKQLNGKIEYQYSFGS